MIANVTLEDFLYANILGFEPKFGTITTRKSGSLTTRDFNRNMEKLITMKNAIVITESSETTAIQYNANFIIDTIDVNLKIQNASYNGCVVQVFAKENSSISYTSVSGMITKNILKDTMVKLVWSGSSWVNLSEAFLNYVYPVGSLYWSSNSTNPSELFGGTWTQIQDKFILSAGSTYKIGTNGGSASVKLDITHLPKHRHGITSHTHNFTPNTISIPSHSHTVSHTHSFLTNTVSHTHRLLVYTALERSSVGKTYAPNTDSSYATNYWLPASGGFDNYYDINDNHTTQSSYASSAGYARYINWGAKANASYKRTIVKSDGSHTHSGVTTSSQSTVKTGDHTLTFKGKKGTTKNPTDNTGDYGQSSTAIIAHNNMPPYIVKYCWKRTA